MTRARKLVIEAARKLDGLGPLWQTMTHDERVSCAQTIGETKALLSEAIEALTPERR